jgi:gliding motility-associated-like protein
MKKHFLIFFLFSLYLLGLEVYAQCPVSVNLVSTPDVSTIAVCKGTPVQIEANPSDSAVSPQYIWVIDGDTILSTDTIINVLANNQNIQVFMATTTGCPQDTVSATIQILTVLIEPTVTPVPSCDLTKADIQITSTGGTAPYTYDLSGIGISNTGEYNDVPAGTYTLYITDDAGCNDTSQVEVIPIQKDLNPDIVIQIQCNQSTADVYVTPTDGTAPYSYDLQGVDQNSNGSFSDVPIGDYTLYTTDNEGCVDTSIVAIVYVPCSPPFPSEFITPNDDGFNDTWVIANIQYYPESEVFIFDRWGQRVYHKKGYDNLDGWDVKYIGRDMPVSTYYYILKYIGNNDEEVVLKGPISIFR